MSVSMLVSCYFENARNGCSRHVGGVPVFLEDWRFWFSSLLKWRTCKIAGKKTEEIKIDCLKNRRHKMWGKASVKVNFEAETMVNTLPPNMLHSCAGVLSKHIINLLSYIITSCMIIQLKAASLVWYMINESIALLWLLYNSLLLYMFVYIYIIYLLSSLNMDCWDASYADSFHQLFF